MYEILSEDTSISDLDRWLAFGDITGAPIDAGWIHPYQRGSASIQAQGGELTQAFDIQSFLVDLDDLDPILNADANTDFADIEFKPMKYGRRRESLASAILVAFPNSIGSLLPTSFRT